MGVEEVVIRSQGIPALALLIEDLGNLFEAKGRFTPWELFSGAYDKRPFALLLEPPSLDGLAAQLRRYYS